MVDVPARELRNETARVLKRVEAGEEVTITVHGRPVARLVKPESARRWMTRDDVVDVVVNHPADAGLREDLSRLAGDTTDDDLRAFS